MAPVGGVTVDFDGSVAKLQGQIDKLLRQQTELENKLKRTGQVGKQAGEEIGQTFVAQQSRIDEALGDWASGLLGAGGILSAYKLVSAELEHNIKLQKEAAGEQITLAGARKDIIRNMAGAPASQVTAILANVTKVAGKTGVDEKFISAAMAQALSASGGDVPASQSAVERAARLLPDKPETIAQYAGSLLDVSKVTGTKDARINAGLLLAAGSLSRVVNPQMQARNIPAALIGQVSYGATPQQAVAALAAISSAAADFEGAISGTASISLAQQLEAALPKEKDLAARIYKVQGDPNLAKKFMENATFERKVAGPIRDLLTKPDSEAARLFVENLTKLPGNEGLGQLADQMVRSMGLDPLEAMAAATRAGDVNVTQQQTGDLPGGRAATVRGIMEKTWPQLGKGATASWWATKAWDYVTALGVDPVTFGAFQLRNVAGGLRAEGTPEGNRQAALAERQIRVLEDLRDKTGEQNETLKRLELKAGSGHLTGGLPGVDERAPYPQYRIPLGFP